MKLIPSQKGKSRAKGSETESTPKRYKTNESTRAKHISELEEDVADLTDCLKYKEKVREAAILARNYKLCDQITEDMSTIKKRRREFERELGIWKRKQQQGKWYGRKKLKSKSSTSESCLSETDGECRSTSVSGCTTPTQFTPTIETASNSDDPSESPDVLPQSEHMLIPVAITPQREIEQSPQSIDGSSSPVLPLQDNTQVFRAGPLICKKH